MQRILIVEDEVKVANAVKMGLEENGFEVDVAYDGRIGKGLAASQDYDLVILDLNLPHHNGYEISRSDPPPQQQSARYHAHRPRRHGRQDAGF